MTFLAPSRLWLLLAVGATAVAYLALEVGRRRDVARFATPALFPLVAPSRRGWRRHVAAGLSGLALVVIVLGLARPARAEQVPRREGTVILVLDVSSSMEATDVSPSRLAAAVDAADGFVADLPDGLQVGLVSYDRTARVLATPTTDHELVRAGLARLTTRRGTDTAAALRAALEALPQSADGDASIVLLSDGHTDDRAAEAVARDAADRDVPITTIAFGTDMGTIHYEGRVLPVPVNEEDLASLADATGGRTFSAATGEELQSVYEDIGSSVGYETEPREVGRWFTGVALALTTLAAVGSLVWFSRIP